MLNIKQVSLKISDKLDLTATITEYQQMQEEIIGLENKAMSLEEYFRWRRRILPFLSKRPTKGRQFLFNLAFIETLVCSNKREWRKIGSKIIVNTIDQEFSRRIQEIAQNDNHKDD